MSSQPEDISQSAAQKANQNELEEEKEATYNEIKKSSTQQSTERKEDTDGGHSKLSENTGSLELEESKDIAENSLNTQEKEEGENAYKRKLRKPKPRVTRMGQISLQLEGFTEDEENDGARGRSKTKRGNKSKAKNAGTPSRSAKRNKL